MTQADKKLEFITETLAMKGGEVYITSATKSWKITKRAWNRFEKAGMPLLKVVDGSLYMASGRKYTCADYCKITAYAD